MERITSINGLKMALKKLTKKDRNEVAGLLARYWKERGMPQYNEKWAEDYLIRGHKKEIKKDEFFVYEENNKKIGVISLITDVSGVAEIRDEVVFPQYQKKYMEKMLLRIIKFAISRKLRKLFSLVLRENVKFYKSIGFRKEGVLRSHFTSGEDLVIMSKFLESNQK